MLDKTDTEIITELKKNSRKSVRDISKTTGIRPSTVHKRMSNLLETGVIEKFTIKLNNEKINEHFIVFVLVKTEKNIDDKVFKNKHIKEVFGITGEYDLMLKLKFKDVAEFNDFIIKFRTDAKPKDTLSMISTTVIKEEI